MAKFNYIRDSVPVGEKILLEVQFTDSAGNAKDASSTPTIRITDAASNIIVATTSQLVIRLGLGLYKYELTVPDGYVAGTWNDLWTGTVDGYTIQAIFDFHVDSQGEIKAINTVPVPQVELGDPCVPDLSQIEISCMNCLLRMLNAKLRNTAFKPDGTRCDVFETDDLVQFLIAALAEFNSTPTITSFTFADDPTCSLFSDVITQGASLIAWAGQAILEAGTEWTITDNGVTFNPQPVSQTITTFYNAQLSDYRAKLKEIKRNLRPQPRGLGAGSILVDNPALRRLRHRRENRLI